MKADEARHKGIEMLTRTDKPLRSASPALDAGIILSHFLDIPRSILLAHPELELGGREADFFTAIEARKTGLPVAYITGSREFWGLSFCVTPAVLIPKSDTEILVERAIALISSGRGILRVLDVCTGSGCIAVSLKFSCPSIEITASDISGEALAVARENARALLPPLPGTETPVRFISGDLRDGLPLPEGSASRWDLIVSNPPYIPTPAARALLDDGRSEPLLALDGGSDGLDLIRPLVSHARNALNCGGILLLETGEYNAKETADWLTRQGFIDIVIHKDLEGQNRVVEGRLS